MYQQHLYKKMPLFLLLSLVLSSCSVHHQAQKNRQHQGSSHQSFVTTLQKHLNAVTNKDLSALASTLPPTGKMQLILPQTEIITTVDGFVDYHRQWFAIDNGWSFETKILNTRVGEKLGMAIVEIVYREPLRNGQPYFNRMIVSYDLEKIDRHWYVIKDHASSVEKSIDN